MAPRGSSVATAQGVANLVGGLWPLVHVRSFEAVLGPKADRWLVKTVSGLLVVNGLTQLSSRRSVEAAAVARRLGIGTAVVLAAIDLAYVPMRRISPMYLLDAVAELGWIVAWSKADRSG